MIFSYESVNNGGSVIAGELTALTRKEALRTLQARGLTVTSIALVEDRSQTSRKRSTPEDLLLSLHEMATLLESGVSIAETIEAQSNSHYPHDLNQRYVQMADEIRKGASFSAALSAAEFALPEYFIQLVKAGELTGRLGVSLREGVTQFEYDLKSREELKSALIYPLILVASGIGAVLLIFLFVVPKFAPLVDRASDLPVLSVIVLNGGMWFNENMMLFFALTALLGAAGYAALQSLELQRKARSLLFHMPIVGGWLDESDIATWTSQMATLLTAKVSLLQALELAGQSVLSDRRRSLLIEVEKEIRAGQGLADALEQADCLTSTGYNLIRSGERAGKLPEMMRSLARLYEDAAKTRMKRMLALIEPLSIIAIGGVIGLIILGVILAITSANELVM